MSSGNDTGHRRSDVVDLLRARRATGCSRLSRNDGAHLALVVEGGGMRGTYAAGMLMALDKLGYRRAFDSIHGSSTGAHLSAYFAAGQAEDGKDLFVAEALDSNFIRPSRLLRGGPAMDVDWMVTEVFASRRRIRLEDITLDAPAIHVTATDAKNGKPVCFSEPQDEDSFFTGLRATAKIPLIAGKAVRFRDMLLTDGGIAQQFATHSARLAGATHVMVLTTGTRARPRLSRNSLAHRVERMAISLIYGEVLAAAYDTRRDTINSVMTLLVDPRSSPRIQGVFVPDTAPVISRLTTDRRLLKAASEACETSLRSILEGP